MKSKKFFIMTIAAAVFFIFAGSAGAVWVWTPKTKKWENPKYAAKDTPKSQFEFAMSYFNASNYWNAKNEFRRLIKVYPNSEFASEAQFYIGLCHQKQKKYYRAFLAYQKTIETYPYSERVDQIILEQYNIGKIFLGGHKSGFLGIGIFPSTDKAIEVFAKVIENAPYGKNADSAQYYLGLSRKKMLRYKKAIETFEKLIEEYPQSSFVEDAKFQIGRCYAQAAPRPGYDQMNTEESIREFKELLEVCPQGKKLEEASVFLDKLKERKAESVFSTGRFYEKVHKYESAQVYYRQILDEYPETSWAARSLERLEVLRSKGKIK